MRGMIFLISACALAQTQIENPGGSTPAIPVVPILAPIRVDAAPLAPADLSAVYASPRDASRHRLQITLSELRSSRDIRAAIRGFAGAFATDRTYAAAAFDLGIMSALAEQWQDASSALGEAARLDPARLGKTAAEQIERLRLIASLRATEEGEWQIRYDLALYPVLQRMQKPGNTEAISDLIELGRIDPKRWEAPGLIAGLLSDVRGYEAAAKFLEIAVANASEPTIKSALQKALRAVERESAYTIARAAAEGASDLGDYGKAAALYENTWAAMPARCWNGMEAAAAWLVRDDTAHAAGVLLKLRESGEDELAKQATRMLAELIKVEPAASAAPADAAAFFRDRGSADPIRISDLLPPFDRARMELLSRPMPKLIEDNEPVLLLTNLAADRPDGAPAQPLPIPGPPRVAGEDPWRELQMLETRPVLTAALERPRGTAEVGKARTKYSLRVETQPAGASLYVNDELEPACMSPCDIQVPPGSYSIRAKLAGYDDELTDVKVGRAAAEVALTLTQTRGSVLIDTPVGAAVKVNGGAAGSAVPMVLSLAPGLYRFTLESGSTTRDQFLMIKPGAMLRLRF